MAKASKAKQLSITVDNRVGLLADVTEAVAAAKVNIVSLCAYEMEKKGELMVIADSAARLRKALSGFGVKPSEDDVILVEMPDRPGAVAEVARKVADKGIDVHYAWATAGARNRTLCVLKTDDDKKAIRAINAK